MNVVTLSSKKFSFWFIWASISNSAFKTTLIICWWKLALSHRGVKRTGIPALPVGVMVKDPDSLGVKDVGIMLEDSGVSESAGGPWKFWTNPIVGWEVELVLLLAEAWVNDTLTGENWEIFRGVGGGLLSSWLTWEGLKGSGLLGRLIVPEDWLTLNWSDVNCRMFCWVPIFWGWGLIVMAACCTGRGDNCEILWWVNPRLIGVADTCEDPAMDMPPADGGKIGVPNGWGMEMFRPVVKRNKDIWDFLLWKKVFKRHTLTPKCHGLMKYFSSLNNGWWSWGMGCYAYRCLGTIWWPLKKSFAFINHFHRKFCSFHTVYPKPQERVVEYQQIQEPRTFYSVRSKWTWMLMQLKAAESWPKYNFSKLIKKNFSLKWIHTATGFGTRSSATTISNAHSSEKCPKWTWTFLTYSDRCWQWGPTRRLVWRERIKLEHFPSLR